MESSIGESFHGLRQLRLPQVSATARLAVNISLHLQSCHPREGDNWSFRQRPVADHRV